MMAASLTPLERPSEAELAEADQSTSIPNRPTEMAAFGDYELLEEIGRGGMGIVYKARQRSLNRIVALKMVIPSRLTSPADLRRFQIEAETAARLDHPHILSIYEVGELSGQPYYTMKWMEGGSLTKGIADSQWPIADSPGPRAIPASPSPTPPRHSSLATRHSELAGLMVKVAHAVAYAHERGVLHRDLKPGNILLDARGEPYVADFGLAKLLEQDTGLTQSLSMLGTPGYAAPEQLQGEARHVTTAADVYSLGAVLYELLTGKPPFRGPTPIETIRQAVDTEVKPPHTLNPAVDRDLETICLKCLNKDPQRRYASAQALAQDLEHWLADEPILARRVSVAERAWLWCRRKPALASLAGALAFTLIVASTVAAWRIAVARQQERLGTYALSIALADGWIKDGSIDRALDLLLKCPPEFRHWEWGYLMAQCHQDMLSIPAHTNWAGYSPESLVSGLAFDTSGTRLLTHGRDGQLKIWDATEGKLLFALDEPTNPVVSWAFHPQQPELALGMTNGLIRMFDTATWLERTNFEVGRGSSRALDSLAQGRVGSAGSSPHQQSPTSEVGRASRHALTNLAAGNLGDEIRARQEPRPSTGVASLAYDPSGHKLAAATSDGRVKVWERPSGRELFSFRTSGGAVDALQYTADGQQLMLQQGLVLRWHEADTGREQAVVELDPQVYRAVSLSPSGRHYATIDATNRVALWSEGRPQLALGVLTLLQSAQQRRVVFSRDERFVCTAGDSGTARVYQVDSGEEVLTIPQRVYDAVFSPDGNHVVTLSAERSVKVWDLVHKREDLTLRGHLSLAETAAFSPDGRLIATASREGVVKVWSARPGRSLYQVGRYPWAVACSPDGRWITAAPYYGDLNLWDAHSGQLRLTLRSRCHAPTAAAFSPNGRNLVTAGFDDTVRLWEADTGRSLGEFPGQDRAVLCATYSPDGRRLAVGDVGGWVRIWDVQSRREVHRLQTLVQAVFYIDFDPSGRKLVAAGFSKGSPYSGVPTVWDVESGRLLFKLDAARSGAWGAKFSPDGQMIAVAAMDGKLRLWDAQTGELLTELACRGQGNWLSFTPDGQRLVFAVCDGGGYGYDRALVQVWDVKHRRQLLALEGNTDAVYEVMFMPPNYRWLLMGVWDFTLRQIEAFPWQARDYATLPGSTEADRVRAYARAYWRDRLAAEGVTTGGASSQPVIVDADESSWPARDPGAGSQLVDLRRHYYSTLRGSLHPDGSEFNGDNDLATLPSGLVTLGGVQFDVRGVVLTRRLEKLGGPGQRRWDRYPTNVSGIQIGQKLRRLQVLQGACMGEDAMPVDIKDGTAIGSYVWRYADGRELEQDIVFGRDLRDWWQRQDENVEPVVERGQVVWTGTNPVANRYGATLRLYLTTYDNPRPDVEVTSIDFVSKMTTAAPFLVAMTVQP